MSMQGYGQKIMLGSSESEINKAVSNLTKFNISEKFSLLTKSLNDGEATITYGLNSQGICQEVLYIIFDEKQVQTYIKGLNKQYMIISNNNWVLPVIPGYIKWEVTYKYTQLNTQSEKKHCFTWVSWSKDYIEIE